MKKNLLAPVTIGVLLLVNFSTASAQKQRESWVKPAKPCWQGKVDTVIYSYQLDGNGKLAWTSDNENWTLVPDNFWPDYDGKLYQIKGTDLMSSMDEGKTWAKLPSRYWRGSDGMWYSFDDNWALWIGGDGSNPPVGIVATGNPYGGTDAFSGTSASGNQSSNGNNTTGNSLSGGANTGNANTGGSSDGKSNSYNTRSNTNMNMNTNGVGNVSVPK